VLALAFVLLVVPAQPVFAAANNPFPATQSVSSEIEFALTGTETGWLRSGDLLFRTESNGTEWQDVTPTMNPDEALVDAYFVTSSRAFALTVSANSEGWQLNLLETADSGFSWQAQPITLPKQGVISEGTLWECVSAMAKRQKRLDPDQAGNFQQFQSWHPSQNKR